MALGLALTLPPNGIVETMKLFTDLFGLKRRVTPRITARWFVDLQVQETGHWVGFYTRDVADSGVRLEGESEEAFRQVMTVEHKVKIILRVPGHPGSIGVSADLSWAMAGQECYLTGWQFTKIGADDRRVITNYIIAHPELHSKEDEG